MIDCTEWQAVWCPVHGNCLGCDRGWEIKYNRRCPLHGLLSKHEPGPNRRERRMLARQLEQMKEGL